MDLLSGHCVELVVSGLKVTPRRGLAEVRSTPGQVQSDKKTTRTFGGNGDNSLSACHSLLEIWNFSCTRYSIPFERMSLSAGTLTPTCLQGTFPARKKSCVSVSFSCFVMVVFHFYTKKRAEIIIHSYSI